jgi:predicted ferric reductase
MWSLAGVMFIGGGIGITPMRAMFWECIRRRIPACVLYAVKEMREAAFFEELQQVGPPIAAPFLLHEKRYCNQEARNDDWVDSRTGKACVSVCGE